MTGIRIQEGSRCYTVQGPKCLHLFAYRGGGAIPIIMAHLRKTALPLTPASNFASQPETDDRHRLGTETDIFILQVICPAKQHHAFPKSPREVIMKHSNIISHWSLSKGNFEL